MKRLTIIITLIISVISTCFAAPPRLACETVFNRRDIRTEGHKVVINKSENNYYRSVTANSDHKLLADIKALIQKDKTRATNIVEGYKDGTEHIILNIPNNGHIINIGMWWTDDGYVHLFIQSELNAFK